MNDIMTQGHFWVLFRLGEGSLFPYVTAYPGVFDEIISPSKRRMSCIYKETQLKGHQKDM